ncbi:MAG: TRAP transporter small permease subunit [Proteobacteria bacterium]|nr:TRAP transporter small permease subunit [Pseudomonadota bacterium]
MSRFEKFVTRLSWVLDQIAGCSLLAMMGLTVADVILRSFRRPILGTYEIVGLMGAIVIAFAMPYTTLQRGHVAVGIVVSSLSPSAQAIINLVTRTLSIILFALIAWECSRYGNDLKAAGEVSMTLRLPFYPILYGIAFAAAVVCLVIASRIIQSLVRGIND